MSDLKEELSQKAEQVSGAVTKLNTGMTIAEMIKVLGPEIKRALPSVMTPERFTRIALSALNTTPQLAACSQMSVLAALMNAAQLGLEPNTPLGQAYLIPYRNKGKLECQFQIGYKGLIDLAFRNPMLQSLQARTVYENDEFSFSYGLNAELIHKPVLFDRGEIRCFYAIYTLKNGGIGFEIMSREDIDNYARRYSKAFDSEYSPWKTNYEDMAQKTLIKRVLRLCPLRTDLQKAISMDESIKSDISVDMAEVRNEEIMIDNESPKA
jgi:recombination protein RecT